MIKSDRLAILQTHCRKLPLSDDVDLPAIAAHDLCKNYSGLLSINEAVVF